MTKEALKLALEALESCYSSDISMYRSFDKRKTDSAITAIKEVLAQPEQDGKCKYCTDGCPACDARKLPEQERFLVSTIGNWGRVEWADGVFPSLGDKMYSAPRTWVGLTDEEMGAIYEQHHNQYGECESANLGYERAIEFKLKEKNELR